MKSCHISLTHTYTFIYICYGYGIMSCANKPQLCVVPWSACMHVFLCSVPSDDGYSEKALLHHAAALSILLD